MKDKKAYSPREIAIFIAIYSTVNRSKEDLRRSYESAQEDAVASGMTNRHDFKQCFGLRFQRAQASLNELYETIPENVREALRSSNISIDDSL